MRYLSLANDTTGWVHQITVQCGHDVRDSDGLDPLARYPTATRAIRVGIRVRRRQMMLTGRLPSWDT